MLTGSTQELLQRKPMTIDYLEAFREVIGQEPIRVNSTYASFKCPFAPYQSAHKTGKDNNPSAALYLANGFFQCFTCGAKLDLAGFVKHYGSATGREFPEIEELIDKIRKETAYRVPTFHSVKDVAPKPMPEQIIMDTFYSFDDSSKRLIKPKEYLAFRGISEKTVKKLNLRYDGFRNYIIFPIVEEGKLYGVTGRYANRTIFKNIPKTMNYRCKTTHLMLGMEFITNDKPFLIVEGLFGYAHLHEIGADKYFDIICILGVAMTHYKAIKLIKTQKPVYILLDNDEAGYTGTWGKKTVKKLKTGVQDSIENSSFMKSAVGAFFGKVPVFTPEWPTGKADPDELTLDEIKSMFYNTKELDKDNIEQRGIKLKMNKVQVK